MAILEKAMATETATSVRAGELDGADMKSRHFLTIAETPRRGHHGDFRRHRAPEGRALRRRERLDPVLEGKTLAHDLREASLRTRVSFEVAMTQLGGHVTYARPERGAARQARGGARLRARLSAAMSTASRRASSSTSTLSRWPQHSRVPVINALSDYAHPCQALADLWTIKERFGTVGRPEARLRRRRQQRRALAGVHLRQAGVQFALCRPEGLRASTRPS